jgi:dihydrofolate reductase
VVEPLFQDYPSSFSHNQKPFLNMRKIVAGFAMSLDGYIEGPNGEYDWIVMEKDFDFAAHMKRFDCFFFGRNSYDKLIQSGNSSFPGIKNYVFSNSLETVDNNFTLLKGDVKKSIAHIKKQDGKDIAVYGGANLLTSLLDLDLVDELNMSIIPVLLGQGKPMVGILKQRVYLTLIDTKRFSGGTVQVIYQIGKNKSQE